MKSAASKVISGIVRDAELCLPLPGVKVQSAGGSRLETLTDENGKWELPAGGGEVLFSRDGFVSKRYRSEVIPGMVRLLSDRLLGYQDRLNFSPGETVAVRVHSVSPYSATLVRYGQRREEILNLGEYQPLCQTVPDRFFVDTGLRWETAFRYQVPKDARPGLYGLLLVSADGRERRFAIPMVVSTPAQCWGVRSRLLVLAGTSTWLSYNIYGGRSRYRNFETTASQGFQVDRMSTRLRRWVNAKTGGLAARAKRVIVSPRPGGGSGPDWVHFRLSVKRPFTNCELESDSGPLEPFTNHLAAGEWRVLAWLEREGIDYDIVSGLELDRNPEILKHYRAILLSTHCEYWTEGMYSALRRFHLENGLGLLNISGNSIYRQIEFYEDGSSRCVSLFFGRDCADETEITGVRTDVYDYATCAPIKVVNPVSPLLKGCPVKKGSIFGISSLNRHTPPADTFYNPGRPGSGQAGSPHGLQGEGASGWETDKRPPHRLGEFEILAKGLNRGGGAELVYRLPEGSRGFAFSASSITFGGSLLIDPVAGWITRNAIDIALGNDLRPGRPK